MLSSFLPFKAEASGGLSTESLRGSTHALCESHAEGVSPMDDIRDIAAMIARLEETGMTRRQIAEGSNVGASAITRIMAGEARNPSFRVISSIRSFYRQHFPNGDPTRRYDLEQRFAPGCQPRAGR
ncbi:helix-turn-helix domain-containing protein [Sinorhizobium medicae]|uniref:Helix-turn-helix domain-containing protein n=2 Tax=Sinorhizobium medicae TaxID=110321 RepID=A0A6G1WU28_9HYPH|nr:helix-turn-helix domain-containing protein [Sinorhizobium medicae]MQX88046.1 helix-turn-helix domain-containing protein [Sinorhizobium medicae]